jgi:hypothetical protein
MFSTLHQTLFSVLVLFENKIRIKEVEEWELRGLVNDIVVTFAAMKLKLLRLAAAP